MVKLCLMGGLLLLVPAVLLYIYKVTFVKRLAWALGKMIVCLGLAAAAMKLVFAYDHWWLAVVWILLMMSVATVMTLRNGRLKRVSFLCPLAAGVVTAVVVTGLMVAVAFSGLCDVWTIRFLIPVAGLLSGTVIETCGKALSTYYMGLRYHGRLYDYLLGNGATHAEALAYFSRRSLERVLLPCLSTMGTQVVATSPVMAWAVLMAGGSLTMAFLLQVVALLAGLCCSVVAVVVTLYVARRFAFDSYLRLKG